MATIANLVVNLSANTANLFAPVDKASAKLQRNMKKMSQSLTTVGTGLTAGLTLPIVGFGAAAIKSAIEFESSFAGVVKTVDATAEELAVLSAGFRQMSLDIPISVHELNRIGEAAGQLGIKTENILSFTRTMADLGTATNMSAEVAATSLARLGNITGMSQDNFDRLGSVVVALGNNMATTESEIVQFGLRLAGAGTQIGLTEAEILAVGGALSSLGIQAEAGGTAISTVMRDMALAVEKGGEELQAFAGAADMSSTEFKTAFEEDAAGAIVAFVEGLGTAEERGKSTLGVLDDMGITQARLSDALTRTAGAGTSLADAIALGTDAWDENTALSEEAEKRYETTAAQLQILKNNIGFISQELGEVLMPYVKVAIVKFKEWIPKIQAVVDWFKSLSPQMQKTIIVIAALAAAVGPVLLVLGAMAAGVAALMALGLSVVMIAWGVALAAVGVAVAAVVTYFEGWTVIGDTLTFLGDHIAKFFKTVVDVFEAFGRPVESVTKLFQWMSDKVVGNSILPEMVGMVSAEFDRMGVSMADRTEAATEKVRTQIESMVSSIVSKLSGDDLLQSAQTTSMAIEQIGGVSKLTAAETASLATQYDVLIAKFQAVGGPEGNAVVEWATNLRQEILLVTPSVSALNRRFVDAFSSSQEFGRGLRELSDEVMRSVVGTLTLRENIELLTLATQAHSSSVESNNASVESSGIAFGSFFKGLVTNTSKTMGGLQDKVTGTIMGLFGGKAGEGDEKGGGIMGSLVSAGMSTVFGPASGIVSKFMTAGMKKMADIALKGLKKIGGFFKKMFSGASAEELGGREVAKSFRNNMADMMNDVQRVEAGNDEWKQSVIVVRDAYIEAGKTEQEALAIMDQLWKAEKQGAGAVEEVIRQIEEVMRTQLTPSIKESGKEFSIMADHAINDIVFLGNEVDVLKIRLERPIVIPITADVSNMPTHEWLGDHMNASAGERAQFGAKDDDELWRIFENWEKTNPGDWHRIPSGFGIPSGRANRILRQHGVPGFAHGGIVNRPTLAMIGEAGPEAVIPLTGSGGQFGGSRSNVHDDELHQEIVALRRDLPRAVGIAVQDALVLAG